MAIHATPRYDAAHLGKNSEQVLDVLGIRKLARHCKAGLGVLQDGSILESFKSAVCRCLPL